MALEKLRGHQRIYSQLQAELAQRPSHAYLFSGPSGVGKALVAESLVHGLLCERSPGANFCCTPDRCPLRIGAAPASPRARNLPPPSCACCAGCTQAALGVHPDFTSVARAANRTDVLIEQVRELIARLGTKPIRAPMRLALLDDAETLNLPAQNALLKTLEEPPGHAIIFLITQSDRALLDTVRSRLRPVRFAALSASDIAAILVEQAQIDATRAAALSRLARGSVARALSMVEGEQPPLTELLHAMVEARALDFPLAQQLAQQFFAAREEAAGNFELIARLFEEILSFKLLQRGFEAPSPETALMMSKIANNLSVPGILSVMNSAVRAQAAIEAMANPRLQAEQWWLAVGRAAREEEDAV